MSEFDIEPDDDLMLSDEAWCAYGESEGNHERITACPDKPEIYWRVESTGHIEHIAAQTMRHHAADFEQRISGNSEQRIDGNSQKTSDGFMEYTSATAIRFVVGDTILIIRHDGAWLQTPDGIRPL